LHLAIEGLVKKDQEEEKEKILEKESNEFRALFGLKTEKYITSTFTFLLFSTISYLNISYYCSQSIIVPIARCFDKVSSYNQATT